MECVIPLNIYFFNAPLNVDWLLLYLVARNSQKFGRVCENLTCSVLSKYGKKMQKIEGGGGPYVYL